MSGITRQLLVAVTAGAILVGPAAAVAQDMTTGDVTRLEQTVDQINADLVQLRQRDRAAARSIQAELMTLDEEVTYLKVKLRRERNVPRTDYQDVRNRLENLASRVSGRDTSTGGYSTGTVSYTHLTLPTTPYV